MSKVKIYVAGKVSKDSVFGTHYWRDEFVKKLEDLSGLDLLSLDPAKKLTDQNKPEEAFGADVYMISQADVVVVYLSDDISVGGSQEILVAKYYNKPVIGLAPLGGKFNHQNKEIFGQVVKDYKHPFVYSTCDVVCDDIEAVAECLKSLGKIKPKNIDIIRHLADTYEKENLKNDKYLNTLINGS
jgi:hypothetical protein